MTGKLSAGKTLSTILLVTAFLFSLAFQASAIDNAYYYQVQPGDSLWLIGWRFETTADAVASFNGLKSTILYPGQALKIPSSTGFVRSLPQSVSYQVKSGDTLEIIAQKFGTTVSSLTEFNKLTTDTMFQGQFLNIPLPSQKRYTVLPGDTLYLLSKKFGCTIDTLTTVNKMSTQALWVGQVLFVPDSGVSPTPPDSPNQNPGSGTNQPGTQPGPGTEPGNNEQIPKGVGTLPPADSIDFSSQLPKIGRWGQIPSGVVLYKVQQGDNLWAISRKFNTTVDAILKTNHLSSDLIQVNQPLFIPQSGSTPVQIPYPTGIHNDGYGELLDWEYASWIADTHSIFTVSDLATGKSFKARRYGGSGHLDAEPLTAADSLIMKGIFGEWTWLSRPVTISIGNKKLAASMSGMPHSFDSIPDNNFTGHFDLYFLNSRSHNDNSIVDYHQKAVLTAAGVIK